MNGPSPNANKALWEKGDFTEIAAFMRESGDALVASLAVRPPLKALHLACCDCTTASPLAPLALLSAPSAPCRLREGVAPAAAERSAGGRTRGSLR